MHKNAQKKKLCFNGYHCFFYHKTSNDIYWEILSNKIQWRIYISSVSHLYIQRLPSIHPTSPIYTSNTFHLYIQYSEIREFSNTKVSNEIAFIKHEESHDYNIGWKLKAKNLSFQEILSAGKPMNRAVDGGWKNCKMQNNFSCWSRFVTTVTI